MTETRNREGAPKPQVMKPLGQRLVDGGLLSEPQLDLALREQKRSGGFLGGILVDLGFVSDEDITATLASEINVEMVQIREVDIPADLVALIPYETARAHKMVPLEVDQDTLTVVFADALDIVAQDAAERASGHTIRVVTAPEAHVLEAIERNYSRSASVNDTIEEVLSGDSLDVHESDEGSPMVRLVDQILADRREDARRRTSTSSRRRTQRARAPAGSTACSARRTS